MNRKERAQALRDKVVAIWNEGNSTRAGITQAQIAEQLGLRRGSVGRLLSEARMMGRMVIAIDPTEKARRTRESMLRNRGEAGYQDYVTEHARKMRLKSGCRG